MKKIVRVSSFLAAALATAALFGCANYEVNTMRGNIPGKYIRYEMQEADRAVETARLAGHDKLCPAEFKAAQDAKDNAYDVFRSCRTEEGAALAKKATEKANALCPVRVVEKAAAPVPVIVPAPPAPPADSDSDGVIDSLDRCPGTPGGVAVDGNGCPIDSDKDGVADYLDKCPATPAGVAVDSIGCPLDSDKDGVADYLDKCPGTPAGTAVTSNGCPPVVAPKLCNNPAVIEIDFDTSKADIKTKYHAELDKIGTFLKEFPKAKGTIEGHTDSDGSEKLNMKLSQARADSVRTYIITKFAIDGSRLAAKGYGSAKPIASNKNSAGKAKNRRIEGAFSCE
ncbi:MAG TPA: OmpA family protein [Desulfuromonadales bacterium]|nr:OmpA family protein [Desulfuromonadales bacterium]